MLPYIKEPYSFISNELIARKDPLKASRLKPWIIAQSNRDPGYTLKSLGYVDVFGDNKIAFYNKSGTPNYKPNPVIEQFSIKFAEGGTLKIGELKIKAFTIAQLEIGRAHV